MGTASTKVPDDNLASTCAVVIHILWTMKPLERTKHGHQRFLVLVVVRLLSVIAKESVPTQAAESGE